MRLSNSKEKRSLYDCWRSLITEPGRSHMNLRKPPKHHRSSQHHPEQTQAQNNLARPKIHRTITDHSICAERIFRYLGITRRSIAPTTSHPITGHFSNTSLAHPPSSHKHLVQRPYFHSHGPHLKTKRQTILPLKCQSKTLPIRLPQPQLPGRKINTVHVPLRTLWKGCTAWPTSNLCFVWSEEGVGEG